MNDAATASHYRICPLCEACCGLEVRTRGREVVAIRGAEHDVFSRGYLCPKGVALKDLHEDPDRLRTPLVRRGGRLVEAGWDEAFEAIEQGLMPLIERHGRDAVALVLGNPAAHKYGLMLYFGRLAKALGSTSIYSASTLDQMPKQLANGLMYGHWLSMAVPDIERTQWLLVIGANPVASNGSLWCVPDFRAKARALQARGGRLIVIDPRRTETAALADAHHFIRPGSDVLLLAAMVHTLFDEGLVRLGRIAEHVNGVDTLRAAVAPFAPERVAAATAIDAAVIRTLARALAGTERACVYGRIGTCTQSYGTLCSWLVDVLNALSGHLDSPGGAMFPKAPAFAYNTIGRPGTGKGIVTGRHKSRVSGAPEVFGELPMGCLIEEITTPGAGQLRGLITVAANPVLSAPAGPRLAAALEQLAFIVSLDIYRNETTRHAHVILPARSPLEDSHYDVAFPQFGWRNAARFSDPVFDAAPGHPPEWQTLLRLAALLQGQGAHADPLALDDALAGAAGAAPGLRGPERLLDQALRAGPYGLSLQQLRDAPGGIDLGELQPRIPEALRTPSGRIELAPPALLADLPRALAELQAPVPPLVLVGRRDARSNNSWMHNLPLLAKGPFRGTALLHPDDAATLGLTDGQMATLRGPGGAGVQVQLELSAQMMRGVVSLPHGWGHDLPGVQLAVAAARPGANLNALLSERARDPLSGNAVLSGVAVTLAPA